MRIDIKVSDFCCLGLLSLVLLSRFVHVKCMLHRSIVQYWISAGFYSNQFVTAAHGTKLCCGIMTVIKTFSMDFWLFSCPAICLP